MHVANQTAPGVSKFACRPFRSLIYLRRLLGPLELPYILPPQPPDLFIFPPYILPHWTGGVGAGGVGAGGVGAGGVGTGGGTTGG